MFPAQSFVHAQQLVRNVQGVCDAIAHEHDKSKDFQNTHGPAHEDLMDFLRWNWIGNLRWHSMGPHGSLQSLWDLTSFSWDSDLNHENGSVSTGAPRDPRYTEAPVSWILQGHATPIVSQMAFKMVASLPTGAGNHEILRKTLPFHGHSQMPCAKI